MPSVQILNPGPSEKLYVGTTYKIQWTSSGASNQRLQYSTDGGLNFNPIQTGLGPNVQQFDWVIPAGIVPDGQVSIAAMVRVVVRDANAVEATSSSNVTIANAEILSVSPNRGPQAGNTQVNILGNGFAPGVNVKFGLVDGLNIQVLGSTQIKVTTPGGAAGAVDVKVKNPNVPGVTLAGGFIYEPPTAPPPTPTVTNISPVSGPVAGNTTVTINGSNFDPQVNVKFGNLDGTNTQVNLARTVITTRTPAVFAAGAVDVKIKNPLVAGITLPAAFTYNAAPPPPPPPPPPAPVVTNISPASGPVAGNTTVTINGSNFDPQVNVKFGNLDGINTQVNLARTVITTRTPAVFAAGAVDIKIKNPLVAGITLPAAFTYNAAPPPPPPPPALMISDYNPKRGPISGNTQVVILGANFDPQVNVKFGNIDGLITERSATMIKVNSPAVTTPGPVELKVKNPNVAGVSVTFTYEAPPPPATPRIDLIEPAQGPVTRSIPVVISGANFVQGCMVRFGGTDAQSVTFNNPGQLTVATPTNVPAGNTRVRIVNPDQTSVSRENGFKFNAPPQITSIDPPEGPREGGITVKVLGSNFQPGASVRFGNTAATGTPQVNADGTSISCILPPGARGAVTVTVQNPSPDLQKGMRDAAFTYLGPQQELAARIFSISPKTVLLDVDTKFTVKGRNLGLAIQQGVFAVRGPNANFAAIQMRALEVSTSTATQEDTVTFFLKFSRPAGLSLVQRVPYYVVASVRPESRTDGFFETSRKGQFTLVTNSSPVAFGVTGQLIDGAANMILLSGRNLNGTEVSVSDSSGRSVPLDYVQARENLLVVGLTLEGGLVTPGSASLTLIDADSRPVGSSIPLDVMPGSPTDENSEVPAGRLKPVPGQQVVTMPEANVGLFAFASSGGGQWLPGSPSFPTSTFSYQPVFETVNEFFIDLVNESIVVPTFGRANTKVGLLRRIRAVPIVIHLEVVLVVVVRVIVFRQGNPLIISPVGNFNEFPDSFPDAFGTYLVFTTVAVTIDVGFLVALVLPDDTLKPLLIRNIEFELSSDKRTLTIRRSIRLRAHIRSIRPRGGTSKLELVAPAPADAPLKDTASFFALYFARDTGKECNEWEFNVDFSNTFLDGSPADNGGDADEVFVVRICSEIAANPNLNKLVLTSDPPAVGMPARLELDTTTNRNAILRARIVPIDRNGNPTGPGDEINPPQVTFRFVPNLPNSPTPITITTGADGQTRAMAEQTGNGQIQAAATAAAGMALLPSSVFGFLKTAEGAQALAAMLDANVSGPSQDAKVRLDFKPIPRAEPFGPELVKEPQLTLTVTANAPTRLDEDVVVKIQRKVVAFIDPMRKALAGPISAMSPVAAGRIDQGTDLEARFRRFFNGDFVNNTEFTITLPKDQLINQSAIPIDVSLFANRKEERKQSSPNSSFVYDALVPPGGKVRIPGMIIPPGESTATQVTVEFKLTTIKGKIKFDSAAVQATLTVDREEDYEEYYRVLTEAAAARGSVFDNALVEFSNRLSMKRTPEEVRKDVEMTATGLFRKAVEQVQLQGQDGSDQPLYWARLTGRVILKQALRGDATQQTDMLELFDRLSRGIPLTKFEATDKIKVVLLGFDPFNFFETLEKGNPAGLAALFLNGSRALDLVQKSGPPIPVSVRSCILPVRYKDFDAGLVETAVRSLIPAADLVITLSQGYQGRYDIEQSAARNRGGATDNRNINQFTQITGEEFRFTTLPWRGLVSRDDLTREGPDGTESLLFNQGFAAIRTKIVNGVSVDEQIQHQNPFGTGKALRSDPNKADAFLELANDPDDPPIDKNDVSVRLPNLKSVFGSTGQYLSNEAFYRVAGERDRQGRGESAGNMRLAMGHIHLPEFLATNNSDRARKLFNGLTDIIRKLLFDIKRDLLAKPVRPFEFKKIVLRAKPRQSLTIPIAIENPGNVTAYEAAVDLCIATPAAAQFEPVGTIGNVRISKRGVVPVTTVTFKGADQSGTYGLACTLRETENGVPVFRTDVIVKVAAPAITSVAPLNGKPGTQVVITGKDFVPRLGQGKEKVDVTFGGSPAELLTINEDATMITCKVPANLKPGMVEVALISPHDGRSGDTAIPIVFGTKFTVTS